MTALPRRSAVAAVLALVLLLAGSCPRPADPAHRRGYWNSVDVR